MTATATADAPAEVLELHEGASASPTGIQDDGRVLVHVIRPCVGRGRGRHLYTAEMLSENAQKFVGWPMYVDHLSPEARRAAGGLPRSLRDVGGVIEESWWDETVPADPARGYGAGAIVAHARPFGLAKKLIEHDPRLVEASISANATGVKPTTHNGQRVWLVEGIEDTGSVDWVTQAGAGGRVVSLMESLYDSDSEDLLSDMGDEEFLAYLDRERPHLREALQADDNADEGGDMGEVTPEVLQEALRSEATQEVIRSLVNDGIEERLPALVEAAVAKERDLIRAEAEAASDRKVDLRDFREEAHRIIAEAKLPDSWKASLRSRFDLTEGGQPTPALDVIDQVDDDGNVTKSARQVLREAVAEAVAEQRKLLMEARPTRVTGQGPAKPTGGEQEGEADKKYDGTLTASLLQEAGIDPETAWAKV
jgi:hypothetical protein